jgi:hypothetical protein
MKYLYFPKLLYMPSSPSSSLILLGSITYYYMFAEKKCEFSAHTGRAIKVPILNVSIPGMGRMEFL